MNPLDVADIVIKTLRGIEVAILRLTNPLKVHVEASTILCHKQLTNGSTTLYLCPTQCKTLIREIHVCNESASAVTFTLRLVPGTNPGLTVDGTTYSGSDTDINAIYKDYNVNAGESLTFHHYMVINAGWYITGLCSATNDLTIHISGVETPTL